MLSVPFPRGVNSTAPPSLGGSSVAMGGGEQMSPSNNMRPGNENVGWKNKGNRNPNGFGGGVDMNPDSGGGSSFNPRSPRATAGGVVGPGPGGARMSLGGGGFARMMR